MSKKTVLPKTEKSKLRPVIVVWNQAQFDQNERIISNEDAISENDPCIDPEQTIGFLIESPTWLLLYQSLARLEDGEIQLTNEIAIPRASVISIKECGQANTK